MKWAALKTSIGLSLLFLLVYGSANVLSSRRDDVEVWVFAWERYIPFVPLMIVPYMSIDLFFVAAPFLARNREDLHSFAKRIAAAIIVAGIFFLAMPLRFSFDRPPVDGILGQIFNTFRLLDRPFNQFPSLHITLCILLADIYLSHTRGAVRTAAQVWFSLIGASTLLVYQHHVIDIVGGFVLAVACLYAFPHPRLQLPVIVNRRIGTIYGLSALLVTLLAILLRPWGLVLLWPATSLGIVAAGYFGTGPGIYRKRFGLLPLGARILMTPVLLGQWWSWRHYAKQSEAWDDVTERLWLGRVLKNDEADTALQRGVVAVLDLTCEFSAPPSFKNVRYLNLPILDLTAPTADHLAAAMRFIDAHIDQGIVYIYCKAGYSRSGATAAAYLLHSGAVATPEEAASKLRYARPRIVLRGEAMRAVRAFHQTKINHEAARSRSIAQNS